MNTEINADKNTDGSTGKSADKSAELRKQTKAIRSFWGQNLKVEDVGKNRIGLIKTCQIRGNADYEYGTYDFDVETVVEAIKALYESGWRLWPKWSDVAAATNGVGEALGKEAKVTLEGIYITSNCARIEQPRLPIEQWADILHRYC